MKINISISNKDIIVINNYHIHIEQKYFRYVFSLLIFQQIHEYRITIANRAAAVNPAPVPLTSCNRNVRSIAKQVTTRNWRKMKGNINNV